MLYQTKNQHGGDVYGGGITLDFSANTNPWVRLPAYWRRCAGLCPGYTATPTPTAADWCRLSQAMSRCRRPIFSAETARQT